jgi:hypothetical protein
MRFFITILFLLLFCFGCEEEETTILQTQKAKNILQQKEQVKNTISKPIKLYGEEQIYPKVEDIYDNKILGDWSLSHNCKKPLYKFKQDNFRTIKNTYCNIEHISYTSDKSIALKGKSCLRHKKKRTDFILKIKIPQKNNNVSSVIAITETKNLKKNKIYLCRKI